MTRARDVADRAVITTADLVNIPSGAKNLIINGDMRIAQRGTSATGLTSSGYFTCDRWRFLAANVGTWTQTQDTDVPSGQGFASSLKMQCTTANASLAGGSNGSIITRLEGQMLQHLKKGTSNAESITMSFWVKSNKIGTYIITLYDGDNNRIIAKSYTISSANTWEKKTITFAGDTTGAFDNDNASSLHVYMWLMAGTDYTSGTLQTTWKGQASANWAVGQVNLADSTSNYINITGVQLEVGDTATPFEHRPYDMELARCLRYYEKSYQITDTPGTAVGYNIIYSNVQNHAGYAWSQPIRYRVEKRATATITPFDYQGNSGYWKTGVIGSSEQAGLASIGDNSSTGFRIYTAYTSTPNATYGHWTASSEL